MVDLSEMFDNIRDAFTGNRRTAIAVTAILVVMTISAVIIVITTFGKKDKITPQAAVELPLKPDQTLLLPPSPVMPDGYLYSRERGGVWSEEDAFEWFTSPTQGSLDELSTANDRIATEITGAAP